jgi:NAD(P)-dependent dehydrogenase (short-subunit alcohol dehydrogenase family)
VVIACRNPDRSAAALAEIRERSGGSVESVPLDIASEAHFFAVGGLPWDDLQAVRFYNVWLTYGRSKLANILFTQELARRWASDGVVASSVHPGIVASNFAADGDTSTFMSTGLRLLKPMTRTPSQGRRYERWLATAEPGGDPPGRAPTGRAVGPGACPVGAEVDGARLWTLSEELIATSS